MRDSNTLRTFEVFNFCRPIGKVRAKNKLNAFAAARKRFPYLSGGEMELQDPIDVVKGYGQYKRLAA